MTTQVKVDQSFGEVFVKDKAERVLIRVEVKENLPRAVELLKKINRLTTPNGKPIYTTRMFGGISVWSFFQHHIVWNYLRDYVKYERIIELLHENRSWSITVDPPLDTLRTYLEISGIRVQGAQRKVKKPRMAFLFFTKAIAGVMTLLAALKLLILRTPLLFYYPDKFSRQHGCDFRLFPIYDRLRHHRVPFVEVFHTLLNREFFRNIVRRRRLAIYIEGLPVSQRVTGSPDISRIDLTSLEPHNRSYVAHVLNEIDKSAQLSMRRLRVLLWLLRRTRVKALLAMDDVRSINELLGACRLAGIRTYGFQHGNPTEFQTGWMNYGIPKEISVAFDRLFVWNEYWKRILLAHSSQYVEDNVEIGGVLRVPKAMPYEKRALEQAAVRDLTVLFPYEVLAPKAEALQHIRHMRNLGAHVLFKVRPDMPTSSQLDEYGIGPSDGVEAVHDITPSVLGRVDLVVGCYSNFLYEMIYYDKPVFVLETSSGMGADLVKSGAAPILAMNVDPDSLLRSLRTFRSGKATVWPDPGRTIDRTLDAVLMAHVPGLMTPPIENQEA